MAEQTRAEQVDTGAGALGLVACPACGGNGLHKGWSDADGPCLECGGDGRVYAWQAHTFGQKTGGDGGELAHVRAAESAHGGGDE